MLGNRRAGHRLAALLGMIAMSAGSAAIAVLFTPAVAFAAPADDDAYKLHMGNGVKVFQDKNYEAAIAEFRAAYRAKPKASPLINIALAEKALFHYPSAITALETALQKHSAEMSAADRKAATDAIAEMKSLLAFVTVNLAPPEATFTIDGEDQPAGAAQKPVPLGPGTHKLEARMDGYTRAEAAVTVASGEKDKTVTLALTADKGYLRIHGGSPTAALSLDEKPVGTGEWAGLVAPGSHVVTMSDRDRTARVSVLVVAGRSIDVDPRGPLVVAVPAATPSEPEAKKKAPPVRGFYGLVVGSLFTPTAHPFGFSASSAPVGGSIGLRAGYRPTSAIGLELMYQYGDVTASGLFGGADAKYSLGSHRIGGNIRFMSGGQKARFVIAVGGGAVFDSVTFSCARCAGARATTGYLNNEIGFELSFGKVLVGLAAQQVIGTMDDLNRAVLAASPPSSAVSGSDAGFAAQLGGGVRIGYATW